MTGNDSATSEVGERSGTVGSTGVIENESSSVSETGGSSPSADIAVSDQPQTAMEAIHCRHRGLIPYLRLDSSTESITSASLKNPNQ